MSTTSELRLTNADLEAMPEDGNRYEVIDGELYVSSAPGFLHQTVLTNIVGAFLDYLREHPIGRVVPGVGVIFDDYDGVIPDLVFATHERIRKPWWAAASTQRRRSSSRFFHLVPPTRVGTVTSSAACTLRAASTNTGSWIRKTEALRFIAEIRLPI
jgi:hypothetical protein